MDFKQEQYLNIFEENSDKTIVDLIGKSYTLNDLYEMIKVKLINDSCLKED